MNRSTSPEWFSPVVNQVMEELGSQHEILSTENFCGYFDLVLARMKGLSLTCTPFGHLDSDDEMIFSIEYVVNF